MITLAHQEHPDLPIAQLCALIGVSKSWYYEHLNQLDSQREDIALRDQIERIILEFSGYGYRRVTHALSRQGWTVNHKHVLRIMREESLLCQIKKHFVITTTNSRHGFPVYPNVLSGAALCAPDQAWVADFTYIRAESGICVPCLYPGCVFSPLCGLVSFTRNEHPPHTFCTASSISRATASARIYSSF